jgi:integrase
VSLSSLRSYAKNLRLVAAELDTELAEASVAELNETMSDMQQRLSANTVQQRQSSLRSFYRYHEGLGIDPEEIYMVQNESSRVDARDPFNREEVDAIRAEFGNTRDRAMFDLMLYTGQRIRAVQTLKVGDVDLENAKFHLNTDAAGLKGAKGMRPLLTAKASVSEWLENHPESDDPDAFLITSLPTAAKRDPYTPVHQTTISRRIKQAAKDAGIDRAEERGHPHNLRHSFVRWAYVELDMDVQTIKYMGGWQSDSQTFEETYFNILDREHAKKAEEAAGVRQSVEDEADLTPASCPTCENVLQSGAKACPRCGTVLSPDAKSAQESVQADIQDAKESEEDLENYKQIDKLERIVSENPELLETLEDLTG